MVPWQRRLRQEPAEEVANSIYGDNYCIFNTIYKRFLKKLKDYIIFIKFRKVVKII